MTLNLTGITDALASHALSSGWFDAVNSHEPKSAPNTAGLTAAVWVQNVGPASGASGLSVTTIRLEMLVRVYTSMTTDPPDMIDPAVVGAVDALLQAYSGDFTLGGLIRNVDLLGRHGRPLGARAGYLELDHVVFRVMDVTVPVIVNDVYDQAL